MSRSKYTRRKTTIYMVEYSYLSGGERKEGLRPTQAQSKKQALADAAECLVISKIPSYTAKVIGIKEF